MKAATVPAPTSRIDEIVEGLPQRASMLSRLFLAHCGLGISRTEAGVMHALSLRPRRVTELAACEGVTQPAISLLANRLERRGWVQRNADPEDGRVILLSLTEEGHAVFDRLRGEFRAVLHDEMAALDPDDVAALARAIEILDGMIDKLQDHRR